MKVPMIFWENFELVAMFLLFGLIIGGGDIGLPASITGGLFIVGMIGIVVGKTRFVSDVLAGHCAGCLSANIVSDGYNGEQISTHLDLFFNESSKINYNLDRTTGKVASWTKTYFLNRFSYINHHRVGVCQAIDVECFGPVLTDSDYGKCLVSLLATSFGFGRTAVVTLYDKNQTTMDEEGVQTVYYAMESARSRYTMLHRQTAPNRQVRQVTTK